MKEIIIEANCVSSTEVKRKQIVIHPLTGLIVEVGNLGIPLGKIDYLYGDECLAFAGLGDIHIHAREDSSGAHIYKEDFCSAAQAAINGGVTHLADMPNNPLPPIDDKSYQKKLALTLKAQLSYLLYAGVGPETHPLSFDVPYKVFLGPSIGELFFENKAQVEKTLERYQGRSVSFHCEDPDVLKTYHHQTLHQDKRPIEAEVLSTKYAIEFIEKYNLKGKLCHFSSSEGLTLVREALKRKIDLETEVTPQHLFFSYENISKKDWKYYQMNPPLRSEQDRIALFGAIQEGIITYLATDHAPHTLEEKEKGMSGLTGLDTYGPFVTWLLKEGIAPTVLARISAENPGRFFNRFLPTLKKIEARYHCLGKGFGFIEPDYCGHITVLELNKSLTVDNNFLKTKPKHSPFHGVTFPGSVKALFLHGIKR
jgi:dihydroorotase